ncbi:MAG TPA: hypothetical protein VFI42_19945 [Thermomicrobiaceae bacterium]|nr:hypothetical protein [Thermomicrobiaceae bacterium]
MRPEGQRERLGESAEAPADPSRVLGHEPVAGQPKAANVPPAAGKREVDLYVRTYHTLLRSSGPITVETLVPAHLGIESSLHAGAAEPWPDMNAFMYSTLRLPASIVRISHILLGQSAWIFARSGYPHIESWQPVTAPGRRRRWYDDGQQTLAAYVASLSDLDDLVPTIVAWQIEWNKLHALLAASPQLAATVERAAEQPPAPEEAERVRQSLEIGPGDWLRLGATWGDAFWPNLARVAREKKRLTLQLLGGTYLGFSRGTRSWWTPVERALIERGLAERPLYFVSSNTHSIVNTLSGTARRRREALIRFVEETRNPELLPELRALQAGTSRSSWENFLYYTARLYFAAYPEQRRARDREEEERGITTLAPHGPLDVAAQIIELDRLDPAGFDPRLLTLGDSFPGDSEAVVININYPLGMSAYHILRQLAVSTHQLRGVYILGKAATLNARIGDVMLSSEVYDEHSGNTYWFENCFSAQDLSPFLVYGAALDHQRAVTVLGTYLQNREYLDFYYRGNYTVVEMEAGPYLSALYEDTFLTRHGTDENVNLSGIPIDLGIIHYASDTPYTRAQTLGARGLSYYGLDSSYASTLVILRRVFAQARLGERVSPLATGDVQGD